MAEVNVQMLPSSACTVVARCLAGATRDAQQLHIPQCQIRMRINVYEGEQNRAPSGWRRTRRTKPTRKQSVPAPPFPRPAASEEHCQFKTGINFVKTRRDNIYIAAAYSS